MSILGSLNKIIEPALGFSLHAQVGNPKERAGQLTESTLRRMLHFYTLVLQAPAAGTIVECGVGWGRSLFYLAAIQRTLGRDGTLYGFDSFEGFPEPTDGDAGSSIKIEKGRYRTSEAAVRAHLVNSGIPQDFIAEKIRLVPGFFEDSLQHYDGGPVSLLHLDVDLYESYVQTLEFFYPRVASGGVIAFDEYHDKNKFPGARRAIDAFLADKPEEVRRSEFLDRYYLIKA